MAEGPPAPPLMFPQPVHVWISLSGMDGLGPAPLETGNGEVSTLPDGCCIKRVVYTMRCVLRWGRRVSPAPGMIRGDGYGIFC